eukprot:TRINITY_DN66859_c0_g1_i1.p1 TRINITY_DN66859_c0_g1~~TRINITY_DN66859_c0_g1_i1.p1  ORF type:complete len:298 (+),score=95.20 TRINITY_DN66859_c0_g1_i1:40-933(+)
MADLATLQTELKAAKERWEEIKLGKAKKEAETFPFPVWLLLPAQQPPNAKALDVYELPVKLVIDGIDSASASSGGYASESNGTKGSQRVHVEVPSSEIPAQLQEKIADAVLSTWKKQLGKKAAPWGIIPTLEWAETNFAKLLMLDPDCLHPYEGCDDNDCSIRRYAIGPPAAPAPEEDEDDDSDEESDDEDDEEEQEEVRARIAALLAEVEQDGGSSGKKKLSPEEIEQRKKQAEEMGSKVNALSKKEREEMAKSTKGKRLAKTGQKARKYEGEGAVSKEEKKKKNDANVKKRFGLA